jgi:flagellar basal body-associated protein FliL
MFCSACGVAINQGLTYCKNCGTKVSREDERRPAEPKPENIIMMMVATFVMGVCAIAALMVVLKAIQFEFGPLMAITMMGFLIMIALEGIFTYLLFRGRQRGEVKDAKLTSAQSTTKQLEAQSQFPLQPVESVTENTTRTLDPVFSERK